MVAAVVAYDNSEVSAPWEGLEDVVGKALCGSAYDVAVHAVCACAHDAAQAACAELEALVESIYESGLVVSLEQCAHFGFRLFVIDG